MGIVEFILFCFGEAFSFSIIWFTITSLFFGGFFKQKRTWWKGFIFTLIILTIANAVMESSITKQMSNDEIINIYGIQSCVIPIFVSIIYWVVINKFLGKIKKWIFNDGNKKEAVSNTNILHFKDNAAAFEMACKFFSGELKKNMAYVGIVDLFDRSVRPDEVSLFVAIDGKSEMAFGFINKETEIKKGDLVLWGFWEMANLGTEEYDVNIPFGIILAIIKPSYDPSKNKWLIERDLTKQQP